MKMLSRSRILARWYSRKRFPRAPLCCFTHWNIFARWKVFADRRYFRTWKCFHGAKRSTKSHRKRGGNGQRERFAKMQILLSQQPNVFFSFASRHAYTVNNQWLLWVYARLQYYLSQRKIHRSKWWIENVYLEET